MHNCSNTCLSPKKVQGHLAVTSTLVYMQYNIVLFNSAVHTIVEVAANLEQVTTLQSMPYNM